MKKQICNGKLASGFPHLLFINGAELKAPETYLYFYHWKMRFLFRLLWSILPIINLSLYELTTVESVTALVDQIQSSWSCWQQPFSHAGVKLWYYRTWERNRQLFNLSPKLAEAWTALSQKHRHTSGYSLGLLYCRLVVQRGTYKVWEKHTSHRTPQVDNKEKITNNQKIVPRS